jgi:hypothetical protein
VRRDAAGGRRRIRRRAPAGQRAVADEEIVALTLASVAINGGDRFAVGLRSPVGHHVSPRGREHAVDDERAS